MGEICRKDGYICVAYSNDHDPPHVHIRKGSWEIKIDLAEDPSEIVISEIVDGTPSGKEKRRALKLVVENLDSCWEEWERIHGES